MLQKESNIKGTIFEYPLELQGYYERKTYNNQEELINAIGCEFEERIDSKKDNDTEGVIKLSDACWYLGLQDTVNLFDNRTIDLLHKYQFYKYTPHLIDSQVWFDAFIIIDNLEKSLTPRFF